MNSKSVLNVLAAAVMVAGVAAAKTSAPALTPDDAILRKAIHEVRMYPHYGVFDNVEVQVSDGTLHVMGEVTEPYKKSDLGHIFSRIPGVTTVDNELKVAPLSPFDNQIRRQVANQIFRDPMLAKYMDQPLKPIHIIVDRGHVTLEGVVRTQEDKQIAGLDANRSLSFGNAVNNLKVEVPGPHN